MALDVGATTSRMIKWLVESIGGPVQETIQIFIDNQGTLDLATNPVQARRNLHVHARYFYVRDLAWEQEVEVLRLASARQIADVGCSFKGGPNFDTLSELLMSCCRVVRNASGEAVWQLWREYAIKQEF